MRADCEMADSTPSRNAESIRKNQQVERSDRTAPGADSSKTGPAMTYTFDFGVRSGSARSTVGTLW